MIARIWPGWAPLATAGHSQRHYSAEASGHRQAVSGLRGARLRALASRERLTS
jgi:hypothetical protein